MELKQKVKGAEDLKVKYEEEVSKVKEYVKGLDLLDGYEDIQKELHKGYEAKLLERALLNYKKGLLKLGVDVKEYGKDDLEKVVDNFLVFLVDYAKCGVVGLNVAVQKQLNELEYMFKTVELKEEHKGMLNRVLKGLVANLGEEVYGVLQADKYGYRYQEEFKEELYKLMVQEDLFQKNLMCEEGKLKLGKYLGVDSYGDYVEKLLKYVKGLDEDKQYALANKLESVDELLGLEDEEELEGTKVNQMYNKLLNADGYKKEAYLMHIKNGLKVKVEDYVGLLKDKGNVELTDEEYLGLLEGEEVYKGLIKWLKSFE